MPAFHYLLFDADDTLFDFSRSEYHAVLDVLRGAGLPCNDETAALYSRLNDALWQRFNRGEITKPQLLHDRFAQLLRALGQRDTEADLLNDQYEHSLARYGFLLPGAEELCRTLHRRGYDMAIVTNGVPVSQHGRFDPSPIRPFFRQLFISEELGTQKPHPAFFDKVCAQLGIGQEQRRSALVIGDSLTSDILGGLNAGLPTCWYNPKRKPADSAIAADYTVNSYQELLELLEQPSR